VKFAAKALSPASPANVTVVIGAALKGRLRKAGPRAECGGKQAGQRWINSKKRKRGSCAHRVIATGNSD
jgi:hypothetical protein